MAHLSPEQLAQEFASQTDAVNALRYDPTGVLDSLVRQNASLAEECFNADELDFSCMDGRLQGPRNVGTGGNGYLWGEPQTAATQFQIFAGHRRKKIRSVRAHESCGAEAVSKVDGQAFSDEIAKILGVAPQPRTEVNPSDHHNERVLYLHLTPTCEPSKLGLVTGYVITPGVYPSLQQLQAEIKLAIDGISYGEHGFGQLFTKENPFVIVIVTYEEQKGEVAHLQTAISNVELKCPVEVVVAWYHPGL